MRMIDYKKIPSVLIKDDKPLNEEKPIISIITASYNASEDVLLTKNSVLSQTFPYYEWIIVDDGSTNESSKRILKELANEDVRIKIYEKENGGPAQARDFAAEKSSNSVKYLFFLDSDDLIEPTTLEILYWTLETHKEASFAYSSLINFGEEEYVSEPYLSIASELKNNNIYIASMVKKEDFFEVGGFGIKEKNMYEDWGLWLKLLGAKKIPIKVSTPLFWYRKNLTGEFSRAKENHTKAMEYINSLVQNVDLNQKVIQFPSIGEVSPAIEETLDFIVPYFEKNEKIPILFIIPWMQMGGADIFNLNLISLLDKNVYDPIIVTTRVAENEIRNKFTKIINKIYELPSFLERKDFYKFIIYIIKARNVQIIFDSNSAEGYGMFPAIKEHYKNIKIIDYIHAVELEDGKGGFGKYSQIFDKYIDYTYTCNNFTKNQLQNNFNKINIKTLYIGTDPYVFDPSRFDKNKLKRKYNIPYDKKVISFIGRLSGEKRPLFFVKLAKVMIKENENLLFILAGDGPLYFSVKTYIEKHHLNKNILLLGWKPSEEIYAISDITVNCSLLEGLALTAYESLSMKVPVISANVGGQAELIDETVGAVIYKNDDCKETEEIDLYKSSILKVLENYNEISSNCRKKIINGYSFNILVNNFQNEIKNLLNNKVKSSRINFGEKIYELILNQEFGLHNWLTRQYYKNNFNVELGYEESIFLKEEKNEIALSNSRLKEWCKKIGIKKEANNILDFFRTSKQLFLRITLDLIIYFKNILYYVYYFIIFLFKSFVSAIIIIYKILKYKGEDNE